MSAHSDETYVSPLMSRLKESEVLSLTTLAKYVPIVQASFVAEKELKDTTDRPRRRELMKTIAAGEIAKERLVLIAMPLIKALAHKEYRRRQAWNSRVPLEDIVSEGLSGLMRGLKAYNVDGEHTSPTNYIGQWILTDMRRNAEIMEHDFSVPYEAMERQRKIRAIRSRLSSSLGHEPTDEEIILAAEDFSYSESMMGKVNKPENTTPSRRRVITQKHLDEERSMHSRTGAMPPSHITINGDDFSLTEDVAVQSLTKEGAQEILNSESVDDMSAHNALTQIIEDAFNLLEIAETQRDVLRRRFSLSPYATEQTIKKIMLHTGVPKHKVNRILAAFSTEMSLPNGRFHELIWARGPEEIESVGLRWLIPVLGDFTPPAKYVYNKDLSGMILPQRKPSAGPLLMSNLGGIIATFICPYHDNRFTSVYESELTVPSVRSCPQCGKSSARVN